jgi:hypothetical protein
VKELPPLAAPTTFLGHTRLVFQRAFEDFDFARDMVIGGLIAVGTLALQVWWKLIPFADWREHRWQWIGSVVIPFALVLGIDCIRRLVTGPWRLHERQELELQKVRQRLAEEIAKNELPEFAGEIGAAFITRQEYFEEDNQKVVRENDSIVMLSVKAWNKRDMSPASIKDYDLELDIAGRKFLASRKGSGKPYRVLLGNESGTANLIVDVGSGLPPLSYLRADGGYLVFFVPGLKAKQGVTASLELGLTDVTGQRHRITSELVELNYGRMTCY